MRASNANKDHANVTESVFKCMYVFSVVNQALIKTPS